MSAEVHYRAKKQIIGINDEDAALVQEMRPALNFSFR
jgi:hypothetical protein